MPRANKQTQELQTSAEATSGALVSSPAPEESAITLPEAIKKVELKLMVAKFLLVNGVIQRIKDEYHAVRSGHLPKSNAFETDITFVSNCILEDLNGRLAQKGHTEQDFLNALAEEATEPPETDSLLTQPEVKKEGILFEESPSPLVTSSEGQPVTVASSPSPVEEPNPTPVPTDQ